MATGKPNLFFLKALVIGLGVAILVCATIIVAELVRRASQSSDAESSAPSTAAEVAAPVAGVTPLAAPLSLDPSAPLAARIDLPIGARVAATYALSGVLAVDLRMDDGSRQILMVDPATGLPLGKIDLVPSE